MVGRRKSCASRDCEFTDNDNVSDLIASNEYAASFALAPRTASAADLPLPGTPSKTVVDESLFSIMSNNSLISFRGMKVPLLTVVGQPKRRATRFVKTLRYRLYHRPPSENDGSSQPLAVAGTPRLAASSFLTTSWTSSSVASITFRVAKNSSCNSGNLLHRSVKQSPVSLPRVGHQSSEKTSRSSLGSRQGVLKAIPGL